jgi:hypothetical protein
LFLLSAFPCIALNVKCLKYIAFTFRLEKATLNYAYILNITFFKISTGAPNLCVLEIQIPYTPWTKSVEHGFSEQIAQFPVKIHAFCITRKFRSAFFWDFTHRRMVVWHRRFGSRNRSHIEGSSCVTYYHSTLRNIPDERRSHVQYGGRP